MYIGDENYIAGYIFSLDNIDSLESCIEDGVYSTDLSSPKKTTDGQFIWQGSHEGTFADYLSMKEGDNVYFFNNRNIYGVGELVKIKFVLEPIFKGRRPIVTDTWNNLRLIEYKYYQSAYRLNFAEII